MKRDYDRLVSYLQTQTASTFYLTRPEIEVLTGPLPASAWKHEQWWENCEPSPSRAQRAAMLLTPYDTFFSPAVGKVRFERRR